MSCARSDAAHAEPGRLDGRRVLVVGADWATLGLLQEWLGANGCTVVEDRADSVATAEPYSLAIVDVPFPRQGGAEFLRGIAQRHPGTPMLALSSTFFGNIACRGPCARALGVAGCLPKPLTRDSLLNAVRTLLPPATDAPT